MTHSNVERARSSRRGPVRPTSRLVGLTFAMALLLLPGCTVLTDEFRATAVPALHSGVQSILSGIVDGFFAVVEPGT